VKLKTILAAALVALASACAKPSADEHMKRADDYVAQNRLPEAVVEYRNAMQADPMRGDVRLKLGEAYLKSGEFRGALDQFVRGADLLPADLAVQIKAGNLLLLAGQFEDAKTRAERVLASEPRNVDAMMLLGNAFAGLKEPDAALAEYQEASVLRPDDPAPFANVGALHLSKGRLEQAETAFKQAVAAAP